MRLVAATGTGACTQAQLGKEQPLILGSAPGLQALAR